MLSSPFEASRVEVCAQTSHAAIPSATGDARVFRWKSANRAEVAFWKPVRWIDISSHNGLYQVPFTSTGMSFLIIFQKKLFMHPLSVLGKVYLLLVLC